MKRLTWLLTPFVAMLAVSANAKPLFNGEDLTGWTAIGGGVWSVEDEAIVGKTGDGTYGWLITEEDYGDFILEFEVKLLDGGNSGVQFRSHVIEGLMCGYQVEVDPDPARYLPMNGGIYDEHGRGWLAQPEIEIASIWKPDDWNRYRVEAIGHSIKTFINDKPIIELEDDNAVRGIIALQVHSNSNPPVHVRFRNITLEEVPLSEEWQPLFDGETLDGWQTIGEEEWFVEDGAIVGRALTNAYGYLATVSTYRDFDSQLEFKGEGTGNSGFFYHSTFQGVDVSGVQVEIDPNPGRHTGGLYESAGRGWLIQPTERAEKILKPIGEWNHIQCSVRGNRIRAWVNGLKAVDFVNEEPRYEDGVLALQLHSGGDAGLRFKNLYLRK